MARHVAEGGKPHDEFGGHIVGLSEEMSKLRKFNNYMGRSAVMAESLSGYVDAVKERISTVKKTIESLQKPKFYAETFAAYSKPIMEDVPTDVAENWIDQLTIKQFNEELADVFPYIYNLVSEATKAKSLGPDDLAEQQLDEIAFLAPLAIPALMAAARLAIPALTRLGAGIIAKRGAAAAVAGTVAKRGAGALAKGTGNLAKGVANAPIKHPIATATLGGGAYVAKKTGDGIDHLVKKGEESIDAIKDQVSAAIGSNGFLKVAQFASKYALPGLAVVAILYGGKKVIDMLRSKDDNMQTASIESIEEAIKLAEQDCWPKHRKVGTQKGTGKNAGKRVNKCEKIPEEIELEQGFEEMMGQFAEAKDTVDEAYIDSAKDASDLLGELRGIGKSFERGQAEMPRGFANRYVSDVWDVYTWIESNTNGFSGIDKNFKSAIDDMMELRGIAKKKELAGSDDSGIKDGAFGNQVVTVLYPVMQSIDSIKMGDALSKREDDESMEEDEQKTPLGEFILSYFDRENGAFPKGETAILTMVEKDYGEQFIEPAKQFIEQVTAKFEELQMRTQPQQMEAPDTSERDRIRELAGLR